MIKHWYKLHKIITIPLNLHSKILVALHCNHLKLCIYLQPELADLWGLRPLMGSQIYYFWFGPNFQKAASPTLLQPAIVWFLVVFLPDCISNLYCSYNMFIRNWVQSANISTFLNPRVMECTYIKRYRNFKRRPPKLGPSQPQIGAW